ncbi:MAG: S8 family peptidase [Bacteroidota bacterium]
MKKYLLLPCVMLFCFTLNAQVSKFGFQKVLNEKPDLKMPFAIVNDGQKTFDALFSNKIIPKSVTKEYIYVTSTPKKINELVEKKMISDFHFEISHPVVLADSARVKHSVDQVHNGSDGLPLPFTGKNVIVGVIDNGVDFYHPDFLDANGKTRVLYFWDQNPYDTIGSPAVPQPYDYGFEYNSQYIDNHIDDTLGDWATHGTNSLGLAAGNGLANGTNKGMAPDSKIIFVKSNLDGIANWDLTVSDACDYIFKKADEIGMPCVINISLGDYLGSHNGNDPATVLIESLLDEKPGRIFVCAAGNSGTYENYHVHDEVDSDTSFTWFENSPGGIFFGAYGTNNILFDLWADQADMQNVFYSFGANLSQGDFTERGTTVFRNAMTSMGSTIMDTIKNSNGDVIATIEVYRTIENGSYHMQGFYSKVDSTSYYYSFKTKGTGKYDLWSSKESAIYLNKIVTNTPNSTVYPDIIHYNRPDSLQSIVSGWACSEKIVTVGNIFNRSNYTDINGVVRGANQPFLLSALSSKGPNRNNVVKPDVVATGNFTFAAAPLFDLANPSFASLVDQGGWHSRASGTSASAPVVAGIAALYLERCNNVTYADFLNDIKNTAFPSAFSGTLPNFSYGYGNINALGALLEKNYETSFSGTPSTCLPTNDLSLVSTVTFDSVIWQHEGVSTNQYPLIVSEGGEYIYKTYRGGNSCVDYDTISFLGLNPVSPTISNNGGVLTCTSAASYQWYSNGTIMNGQTFQFLTGQIQPNRIYTCCIKSPEGCESCSNQFQLNAGIQELNNEITLFPNPTENSFEIINVANIQKVILEDLNGKKVKEINNNLSKIDISDLKKGIYFVKIVSENQILFTKIERL